MCEEKNRKNPAVTAELFELSYCTSGTVLESKLSHGGRKHNTVSFRNSAIPAAKTLKTCTRAQFTNENSNRLLFFMFFPRMQSAVRRANPLMARSLCESVLSGTNERGSNEGRRPQTAPEGFLRFL